VEYKALALFDLVLDGVCNPVRNVFSRSILQARPKRFFFRSISSGKSDGAGCKPAPTNSKSSTMLKNPRNFQFITQKKTLTMLNIPNYQIIRQGNAFFTKENVCKSITRTQVLAWQKKL